MGFFSKRIAEESEIDRLRTENASLRAQLGSETALRRDADEQRTLAQRYLREVEILREVSDGRKQKLDTVCDELRRTIEKLRTAEDQVKALELALKEAAPDTQPQRGGTPQAPAQDQAQVLAEAQAELARVTDLSNLRWAMLCSLIRQQPHKLAILRRDRMIMPLANALNFKLESYEPHPGLIVWELHDPMDIN